MTDEIAQALADPDNLTATRCRELSEGLWPREQDLTKQMLEIHNPDAGDDRWRQALAIGDEERVRAEYDQLQLERDRVQAQRSRLHNLLQECAKREAVATLPDQEKALDKAADKVTRARKALADACAELENQYTSTSHAMRTAQAGVDPEREALADKVINAASGAAFQPSSPVVHSAKERPGQIYVGLNARHAGLA
ncbi:hypothetical protein [Salinisphaera orenii]|uniref:hypothetical protein n=1 Tax=Salinisphaera orenii TaxID=856731 RepID=UPI000DBE66D8